MPSEMDPEVLEEEFKIVNWEDNINYVVQVLLERWKIAFKRGDKVYKGSEHYTANHVVDRTNMADVRHVTDCHAMVRLREAEDAFDNGKPEKGLAKLESAMGYLIILHARIRNRVIRGSLY